MKVYLEAIRALPDEYVAEDTRVMSTWARKEEGAIAVNPRMAPIIYRASTRSWEKMKFDQDAATKKNLLKNQRVLKKGKNG